MIYISDFFMEDTSGGAEQNDNELLDILKSQDVDVSMRRSGSVNVNFLMENKNEKFIISNFINLGIPCINYLTDNCKYVIYEHDHKYLKTRNPSDYKDFIAPSDNLVNVEFYRKAVAVLLQSSLHKRIIDLNIEGVNSINLGGNLWTESTLDLMEELSKTEKCDKYSIMGSQISHKNTGETVAWCISTKKEYVVIGPQKHEDFISELAKNKVLIFNPKTVETLSRIVVEARMVGCSVLTNSERVGALSEPWIVLSGVPLINLMREKRVQIPKLIIDLLR